MSTTRPRQLILTRPGQIRALTAPLAHRVVAAFERMGPATIAEVADTIGAPPESLYYHVRRLSRAGILIEAERRDTGGRPEIVWEIPGREVAFDHTTNDPDFLDALCRAADALLRLASRTYHAAVRSGASRRGRRRTLMLQQHAVRLRARDLEELNNRLEEIADFIAEHDAGPGTPMISLTMVMAPE